MMQFQREHKRYFIMKELIMHSDVMAVTKFIHVIKFMEHVHTKNRLLKSNITTFFNKLANALHVVREIIIILPELVSAS